MTTLARSEVVNVANPQLVAFVRNGGYLVDAYELKYTIYNVSDDVKRLVPVKVYPADPDTQATVDLVNDRLGLGRYVAKWTVPADEALGMHMIKWYLKLTATGTTWEWTSDFDVLAGKVVGLPTGYVTPTECRAQGITTAMATEVRLQQMIAEATRYITKVTGRSFVPTWKEIRLDGRGSRILLLDEVICAIEEVNVAYLDVDATDVEEADFAVYNRHLSQGLLIPDDRENPKLVLEWANPHADEDPTLLGRLAWPRGHHNIVVSGVFGYTDPDGSPCGATPEAIKRAAMLLVYRNLLPLITSGGGDPVPAGPIVSEKTQGQSVSFQAAGMNTLSHAFTGDPAIDQILAAYRRPSSMGAA
jgi:hypothetical protein